MAASHLSGHYIFILFENRNFLKSYFVKALFHMILQGTTSTMFTVSFLFTSKTKQKTKTAVYMLKLSRTEMLSTVPCSKFRGASFTFFSIFALKNAKIHGILPPEAKWVEGITLI